MDEERRTKNEAAKRTKGAESEECSGKKEPPVRRKERLVSCRCRGDGRAQLAPDPVPRPGVFRGKHNVVQLKNVSQKAKISSQAPV